VARQAGKQWADRFYGPLQQILQERRRNSRKAVAAAAAAGASIAGATENRFLPDRAQGPSGPRGFFPTVHRDCLGPEIPRPLLQFALLLPCFSNGRTDGRTYGKATGVQAVAQAVGKKLYKARGDRSKTHSVLSLYLVRT
jgi:hypothetical protein